jgi:hypothetical protein
MQSRRDRDHGYESGTGKSCAAEPLGEPNLASCGQPISHQMCVQYVRTAAINFASRQLIVSDAALTVFLKLAFLEQLFQDALPGKFCLKVGSFGV